MSGTKQIRGLNAENVWDYENGFYWFSDKTRINKLLAHYELYKTITNLPGHIFELGVYKSASIVRFATFRDCLENDFSRKIVGFDAFGEFPKDGIKDEGDLDFISEFEMQGGEGLSQEEVNGILTYKGFQNIQMIKGNVFDTLPKYLLENPETRLALVHFDMDVKEPTDFAIEMLYERVVPGGLLVFDDYNAVAGETASVDALVAKFKLKLEKLPFYNIPAYIIK